MSHASSEAALPMYIYQEEDADTALSKLVDRLGLSSHQSKTLLLTGLELGVKTSKNRYKTSIKLVISRCFIISNNVKLTSQFTHISAKVRVKIVN